MSEQHTLGPWRAKAYLALGDFLIYGANGEEVAVVNANNGLDEPDWYPSAANAALIAAAPELRDALRVALANLRMAQINADAFGSEEDADYLEAKAAWDADIARCEAALAKSEAAQ